jgi:hypothetical protein
MSYFEFDTDFIYKGYHKITASADGAYQKRGSGRCFNSLSGKMQTLDSEFLMHFSAH